MAWSALAGFLFAGPLPFGGGGVVEVLVLDGEGADLVAGLLDGHLDAVDDGVGLAARGAGAGRLETILMTAPSCSAANPKEAESSRIAAKKRNEKLFMSSLPYAGPAGGQSKPLALVRRRAGFVPATSGPGRRRTFPL